MRLGRTTTALLSAAVAVLALTWCSSSVDPNKGHFSCSLGSASDCGSGYECRPQAYETTGICYPKGQCTTEVCDGLDNDCNGIIDDGYDFTEDPNNCGNCGVVCGAGTGCIDGLCQEILCSDGVDNNGDGLTDCADPNCTGVNCIGPAGQDAGFNCGRQPPDGGLMDGGDLYLDGDPACVPVETLCADGLDNDGDGLADCSDPDCDTQPCDDSGDTCQAGICD